MKLACGALMIVFAVMSTSCFPVIANLSKGSTVPGTVATYFPSQSRLLVVPLWSEYPMWTFRDPYIIPASAIGTPDADVPRRTGFYIDTFACGGPWKYVIGYLIVPEDGSVIWSDLRRGTPSDDRVALSNEGVALRSELKLMFMEGEVGPRLRELMQYGTLKLEVHVNAKERAAALSFLQPARNEE